MKVCVVTEKSAENNDLHLENVLFLCQIKILFIYGDEFTSLAGLRMHDEHVNVSNSINLLLILGAVAIREITMEFVTYTQWLCDDSSIMA